MLFFLLWLALNAGQICIFKGTVRLPLPAPVLVLVSSWKHELTKVLMKIPATEMRGAQLWPGGCRDEGRLLPPWGVGDGISKIRGVVSYTSSGDTSTEEA